MDLASEAIRVLRRFKNAIIEGPPGTGKTFAVEQIAARWQPQTGRVLGGDGWGRYAIVLHPSTTYEEFVEGLRYDEDKEGFVRRDGFLREAIHDAIDHPEKDYLVLIDEINRANIPKVLGDVLLCMETTKRSRYNGTEWAGGMEVTLPYSGKLFSIPDNIYLLGTMNSSDRSIAPLDSALRRRFGFVRAEPIMGAELRDAIAAADGADAAERLARSVDELTNLNEVLRQCLGPDAMLGHSYLFGAEPTRGLTAALDDPLREIRDVAAHQSSDRVFWLEVKGMWGYNVNQFDVPDNAANRRGLVDQFYPMSSEGATTQTRSPPGSQDRFDIHFAGETFVGNTIEYNTGGSNVRLKYQGRTADGQGILALTPPGSLGQKFHVFIRRSDYTLDLVLLDRDESVKAALEGVSHAPNGWYAQTRGSGGRAYGVIDLESLVATGSPTDRTPDEDAEWMTWRYAILPQLIETVTQLGATDLLDPATRIGWLQTAGQESATDRWAQFDVFLAARSLGISEEGHGLGRALSVTEIPVGADPMGHLAAIGPTDEPAADIQQPDSESNDDETE
jgi:MoxR-like ATPase